MKKYLYLLIAACMLFLGAVQAQYLKTDATKNFFQLRDAIKKEVEEKKSHEEFESGEHEHDDLLSKFYRWEHFMLPRVSPQGNLFTPDAVYNAYRNYFSINTKSPLAKSNAWQAVGPFTDITDAANFAIVGVGRMNCVTQHPLDSNTLFVGTMGGGIWKTTNNGASWICLDENLPSMSISDIAINPIHPDTMYIATGDAVGNYNVPSIPDFHQGHYSCGVMMSTDGGASWLPTGFTYTQMQAENIYRLVVDPIEPSHLLIGCDKGMYRSIDAGMTWAQLDTLKVVDIQINPLDANKYYAITKNGSRLSRSYDGGASFSITNANNFFGGVAESNVRISPADTSKIYIARGSGHLLRSGNGGASFQIVNNFGNSFGFQGDYDKALALSPVDTNMMMLGLVDLIKSTNKGTTFSYVDSFSMTTSFPLHVDFHELEYSIFDSHKLYAANDGGIYVSYDDGESWTSLNNGLNVTQYYKMNSSNLNPNLILAGAQDNNTHLMDDQQWTIVLGGDGLDCSFDKGDENTAYASYQSGNVFRSSDGGKVFSKYITPPNFIGDWETPHLANPLNTNKIFIGGDKIYASYNKGDKWNIISAILDSNFLITSMAQSPNDTSVLYAASYRTIHVTHDNGLTWSNITTGLPADSASITDLKTDDNDAKIVYVTLSGFASGEKIYKTIDGGNTWTNISGTLPNVPFNTIVIQSSPLHDMYAGCDFGVFYKNDTMSDWLAFNNNLPGVIISDLDINYRSGKLFTATHGRGIYVVDLLTPVTAIANDAAITQILYPEVQEYCDSILSPLVVRIMERCKMLYGVVA
jgi:photosystem II stability/assembly factor-like uncharacterized protein